MRCPSTLTCTYRCVGVIEVLGGVVATRACAVNGMLEAECPFAKRNSLHKVGVTQIQHSIIAQMRTKSLIMLQSH